MTIKSLNDVAVGDAVFRFIGDFNTPIALQVTAVTEDRIICGEWQFDKRTGAEIDELIGWGPALTGSYVVAVPSSAEEI